MAIKPCYQLPAIEKKSLALKPHLEQFLLGTSPFILRTEHKMSQPFVAWPA
jgi:hypothetical protein